jgi:hypothetical protein
VGKTNGQMNHWEKGGTTLILRINARSIYLKIPQVPLFLILMARHGLGKSNLKVC